VTRGDKTLIAIALIIAIMLGGLIWLWKTYAPVVDTTEVVIEVDGKIEKRFFLSDLKAGEQFKIKGILGYSLLEVGGNEVRAVESPCPDKICIGMGWISHPGQSIVCIPNRVVVRIVGTDDYDYDGLSQ